METDLFREWGGLCEEHDAVRDKYFAALAAVRRRFDAIQKRESTENPTLMELEEMDQTRSAWEAVMRQMDAFLKRNL